MQTKLRQLSPEQNAGIEDHRKRWAEMRSSTGPADRERAALGIAAAYQAAGWPAPKSIDWCSSPMQMEALWAKAAHERIGPNLKASIVDHVRNRAAFGIQRRVSGSVLAAVDELNQPLTADMLGDSVRDAVIRASHAVRPASPKERRWLFWLNRGRGWLHLQDAGFSPRNHSWLERHDLFRTVCGLEDETEDLRGLLLVAASADWIIPHKHVCWVSEPPQIVRTDAKGRLHSSSGPALRYRDGWTVYAWKGVEVPARFIERPAQITHADIDRATDIHVRRCLIELLTPERFIASGAAFRISEDETGVLWERRWPDGDAWAAVEVINGTPELDGTQRRYFLQVPPNMLTARSAVAWTYGMTARQYRGLLLRT
ncbi:MAG: DUF6745 domain-containing protein [Rhodomicrobium sp.]